MEYLGAWVGGRRTHCRFPNYVADGDAPTCAFAEFSPKWRTRFSHLRGESYVRAVVHDDSKWQPTWRANDESLDVTATIWASDGPAPPPED